MRVAIATHSVEIDTALSQPQPYVVTDDGWKQGRVPVPVVEAFFGMPQLQILYWRDIPAQVIVKQGRKAAKRQLPERFEQAIDRCAMKVGARDTDAYLAEWRRGEPMEVEGDPEATADEVAARLEAEFDPAQIKRLIDNDGWMGDGPAKAQT